MVAAVRSLSPRVSSQRHNALAASPCGWALGPDIERGAQMAVHRTGAIVRVERLQQRP